MLYQTELQDQKRATGLEPVSSDWQTEILPTELRTHNDGCRGEIRTHDTSGYEPAALTNCATLQ